jgi:cell division protein FtsI/penicillin-binding protein 2
MKKLFLIIFLQLFSGNIFAMSPSPDYNVEGLLLCGSLSLDYIFDSSDKYFTLDLMEFSLFPPSSSMTIHIGTITQFSFDVNIFDIYESVGVTIYPFKKIFSLSTSICYGLSIFTLNHFSYIADIKANIDIPIYKGHNVTFGVGLRHRNALKIIGYFNLHEKYYNSYNSYFFEIGYRYSYRRQL